MFRHQKFNKNQSYNQAKFIDKAHMKDKKSDL